MKSKESYYQTHKKEVKTYQIRNRKEIRSYKNRYYQEHKEEAKVYRREHSEEISTYNKNYYQVHKEKLRSRYGKYYQKHKAEVKAYRKNYYQENKNYFKEDRQRRENERPYKEMGNFICQRLKELNKSKAWLAKCLGIKRTRIYWYVNGVHIPRDERKKKICEALKIRISDLEKILNED